MPKQPNVSDNVRAQITPARLRSLSTQVDEVMRSKDLDPEQKGIVTEFIDLAMEKVTKYRDILPQATTLQKLRSARKEEASSILSSSILGKQGYLRISMLMRVSRSCVMRRQKEEEAEAVEEKKKAMDMKKALHEENDREWRVKLDWYNDFELPHWQSECTKILQNNLDNVVKKPPYPPRPRGPIKPKIECMTTRDLSTSRVGGGGIDTLMQDADFSEVFALFLTSTVP